MPDSYSPQYVEAAWYPWWEQQGFFKPEYGVSGHGHPDLEGRRWEREGVKNTLPRKGLGEVT